MIVKDSVRRERYTYLDGLRGLAALVGMFHHCIILFAPALYTGQRSDSKFPWDVWVSGKPFLVFFAGNFSVCIFFLLSGFVLSHVFVRTSLGPISSVVKRYIRMTIPVAAANLFSFAITIAALAFPALRQYVAIGPGTSDFVLSFHPALHGLESCLKEALVNATIVGVQRGDVQRRALDYARCFSWPLYFDYSGP